MVDGYEVGELADLLLLEVNPAPVELGVDLEVLGVDLDGLLASPPELRVRAVDELEAPPHLLRDQHVVYVLDEFGDEYLAELALEQVIVDLCGLVADVAVDEVELRHVVVLLAVVGDFAEAGGVDGALEAADGVDALGAADALGALEAADGLLGLEGLLRAQGLHGAVVGQVVGEAVELQVVLLVDVGLPALEPLVVH